MVTTPDAEDLDWVPLQNPFSRRQQQQEEEEEFSFAVERGASATQLCITFTGWVEGEEECELREDMSFDKLLALHRYSRVLKESKTLLMSCVPLDACCLCHMLLCRQMVELYPDEVREELLPELPSIPRGIWSYLLPVHIREDLYREIKQYLTWLSQLCGIENVLAVFFADAFWSPAKYEEEWSDLNKKQYLEERDQWQQEWEQLLARKTQTHFTTMTQLHDYYEEEDVAQYHLERVEDRLHTFHTKPFEDLSEIARKRRDKSAQRAKMADLSVAEQVKALHEEREFHEQFLEACESLHELVVEKHRTRAERIEHMLQQMAEDSVHLGSQWDRRAQSRRDQLENKLNGAIVGMLETQVQCLSYQKDRAMLAMAIVEEGPHMEAEVREREDLVFSIQLRLSELKLRLLEEDERRLRLQEKYAEGKTLAGIRSRLEKIPSKMAKIRLKMVSHGPHFTYQSTTCLFCLSQELIM